MMSLAAEQRLLDIAAFNSWIAYKTDGNERLATLFERRFSPGAKLDNGRLQTGDELLGQQVMFLTIDADGSIQSCRVVGTSGDMVPAYGCTEAKSEQFRAEAAAAADTPRQAFMTIRVFGHQEQIV